MEGNESSSINCSSLAILLLLNIAFPFAKSVLQGSGRVDADKPKASVGWGSQLRNRSCQVAFPMGRLTETRSQGWAGVDRPDFMKQTQGWGGAQSLWVQEWGQMLSFPLS